MAISKIGRNATDTGITDSSDATAITIDSSERVGIGTTSPQDTFHAYLASGQRVARFEANSSTSAHIGFKANNTSLMPQIGVKDEDLYMSTGDGAERMRIRSTGDLSLQKNTSGFGNITSFGTVTLADDASLQFTSGTHTGGANHVYVYETSTGSNAVYYGGFNKAAVLNGNYLETGGIGFASSDSDGNVSFYSDGTHQLYLKNREGSSKTFIVMKVGVGATFNDTV
jgi:hypothetical protein